MELTGLIGFMAGNVERLSSLSVVSNTTSTAITIAWPGGLQEGDVAVLYDRGNNVSGVPTLVVPTGFTQIQTDSLSAARQSLFYKVLDGTEAGNITGSDSITKRKMLLILRGNLKITGVAVNGLLTSGMIDTNPSPQICLSGAGAAPLAVFCAYGSSGTVSPTSFSPGSDGSSTAGAGANLLYKIYDSSPADVTVDMDDEGDRNCLQSFFLTFTT